MKSDKNDDKAISVVPHPCDPSLLFSFLPDLPHISKNLRAHLCCRGDVILSDEIVREEGLSSNRVTRDHLDELIKFQSSENEQLFCAPALTSDIVDPGHFEVNLHAIYFCMFLILLSITF